jgi:hypothetical protein
MNELPTLADDMIVARTNEEIVERLAWLFHRMATVNGEIAVLLRELGRRRASLPPTQPT